jgi:signal transduction histidine kinase
MAINITGFMLALIIVLHLWTIVTIYRQRVGSILSPLFVYLNFLMILVEVCTLFFLTGKVYSFTSTVVKVHYIAEVFIPPIIIYLTQTYLSGSKTPRFTTQNILFFGASIILGFLGLSGLMINGVLRNQGVLFPFYTVFYWPTILYFYLTFGFILVNFLKRYQHEKRQTDLDNIRYLISVTIPVAILSFTILKLFPLWDMHHPLIYLNYPILGVAIVSLAFKFQMIDFDDQVSRSFSFFVLSGIFIIIASLIILQRDLIMYLISIPLFIGLLLIFQALGLYANTKIRQNTMNKDYDLDEELEVLLSGTEKYIDNEALAQFIGELSLKVLRCTKSAVITSRFDVKPYQITYLNGFIKEELEALISAAHSPFIETLEFNRVMVNKFELSQHSALYQTMDRHNIYLVIPMSSQTSLLGFILLGGDRKYLRITHKDLRFGKFLALKASYAFQNIQEIQKVVQSQKMADLGMLASQLAHDFQSFITLVKLQSNLDDQLRQLADSMEKMVKDLLNYARPKDLRLDPVNINELVDMSLDLIKIHPSIQIERHYSDSVPQINVDIDQMRRVFINLFENSISAMGEKGGRLKISTRPLRPLSNFRRNTWLYIEILDDGGGIPQEFLDKIFDPFFTTRKHQGGSGLGLAIVKQIISRHKGFIDVTSKAGKGTIFNIRLPYLR